MAVSILNPPVPVLVQRGRPVNLGTITATGPQAVQFTIAPPHGGLGNCPNGSDSLVIVTTGTLSATVPILEGSLDGGVTWFGIVGTSGVPSTVPVLTLTPLTGDTAVTTANSYPVSGISGITFRFGFNTYTSGSGAVWIYMA